MYKLLKTIPQNGAYSTPNEIKLLLNDTLYLSFDNVLYKLSNYDLILIAEFHEDINLIQINNDFFLIKENRRYYLFDVGSNKVILDNFFLNHLFLSNPNKSNYIHFFIRSSDHKYSGIYDILNKKKLFVLDKIFNIEIVSGNYFFNEDESVIKRINDNGDIIWFHDLSHLGAQPGWTDNRQDKLYKFLGVVQDKVFVLSEAGKIVVLELNNGNLIKVIYSEEFPRMWDAFLHPDNHAIYCLSNRFVKINTQTLEIETIKQVFEENRDPNFNTVLYGIKNSSFQGKYISFTSFTRHRSGFAKYIGLLDYESENIVWHYELLPEEGQLSIPAGETPQLAGDNLYVLDSNNTLHIFKRDN